MEFSYIYALASLFYLSMLICLNKGQDINAPKVEISNQVSELQRNDIKNPCKDVLPKHRCHLLKKVFACTKSHERMKIFCPRTCGFCPYAICEDQDINCKDWTLGNGCKMLPEMVGRRCPRTCNLCGARTPCDTVKCPHGQRCRLDLKGRPSCSCAFNCRRFWQTGPVCGSNGKTYDSFCELVKDECKQGDFITVKHYGKCIKYEPCSDNAEPPGAKIKVCEKMSRGGACKSNRELMQFYCARTCKLCRQLAPSPSCATTKYGCCWNKDIAAQGKYGEGCGACVDKPLCKYFRSLCWTNTNVKSMKLYCPVSCHYCVTQAQIKRGYR